MLDIKAQWNKVCLLSSFHWCLHVFRVMNEGCTLWLESMLRELAYGNRGCFGRFPICVATTSLRLLVWVCLFLGSWPLRQGVNKKKFAITKIAVTTTAPICSIISIFHIGCLNFCKHWMIDEMANLFMGKTEEVGFQCAPLNSLDKNRTEVDQFLKLQCK